MGFVQNVFRRTQFCLVLIISVLCVVTTFFECCAERGVFLVELSEIEGFALRKLVRKEKTNYFCKAIRMHERRAQSGSPLCAVMFAAEDG